MNLETKEVLKKKLNEVFEKIKKNKYLFILLAAGVLLMVIPSGKSDVEIPDTNTVPNEDKGIVFNIEEQENRLEAILSKVSGAGKVEVLLSLQTSTERILAEEKDMSESISENEHEKSQTRKPIIISERSSDDTAVTVKYIYPQYLGAVIVAEGGDNAAVKLALTEGVSAVTGLSSNKIKVIKMK